MILMRCHIFWIENIFGLSGYAILSSYWNIIFRSSISNLELFDKNVEVYMWLLEGGRSVQTRENWAHRYDMKV